jgi:single-stranded DNA-binding protein
MASCDFMARLATFASQFIRKGSFYMWRGNCVTGIMKIRTAKKYVTEIIADHILLLDKKDKTAYNRKYPEKE